MLVTAKSTDTFTITRAQRGTIAREFSYGDLVANGIYVEDIDDAVDTANVDAAGATMNTDITLAGNGYFLDEDSMTSNSDTKVPSQQSVKAYVDAAISAAKQALMPVGTIVVLGVSTNPNTLYGFGTWTAVEGKVLVGKAASGTFGTLDATGGAETHTLTNAETPVHSFNLSDHGDENGSTMRTFTGTGGSTGGTWVGNYRPPGGTTGGAGSWFNPSISWGGGGAHNNLQPYIVKYMWQRTA